MSTILWAPWRIDYILSDKHNGCLFCDKSKEDNDEDNLILLRKDTCLVMTNRYPYKNGHLLIAPYRHIPSREGLTIEEMTELMVTIKECMELLRRVISPDGFNIGMNIGKVAGAGIAGHCHFHIVPRWNGDTNFMPVLADARVMPEHLRATYKKLKEGLSFVTGEK